MLGINALITVNLIEEKGVLFAVSQAFYQASCVPMNSV